MILKLAQFKLKASRNLKNYLIRSIKNRTIKKEVYEMVLDKFDEGLEEVLISMRLYDDDVQLCYSLEHIVQYRRCNGLKVNEVDMCFIFDTVYYYIKNKTRFMMNVGCDVIDIREKRYLKIYKK